MKVKLILLVMAAMMLPTVASAQLITSAQTITVREKSAFEARYEQSIELPFATDFYAYTNYVGINYIGGCRFSNLFFLGAGIGININFYSETSQGHSSNDYREGRFDAYDNLISIPLYLHTRLYFTDTRCQPFFAFSIGGHLTGSKKVDNAPDVNYNPSCFFFNPIVGLNFRTAGDFNIYFSTGLMARNVPHGGAWHNYGQDTELHYGFDAGLAWSLNLGVTF